MRKAQEVINFIAALHGMDNYELPTSTAAIDIASGAVFSASKDFPDGDMLSVTYPGAIPTLMHTYKLLDVFNLRHARFLSETDGGSVKKQFEGIQEHFEFKTDVR